MLAATFFPYFSFWLRRFEFNSTPSICLHSLTVDERSVALSHQHGTRPMKRHAKRTVIPEASATCFIAGSNNTLDVHNRSCLLIFSLLFVSLFSMNSITTFLSTLVGMITTLSAPGLHGFEGFQTIAFRCELD